MELYSEFFSARKRWCEKESNNDTTSLDVLKEILFDEYVIQTCDKICRTMFECNIFSSVKMSKFYHVYFHYTFLYIIHQLFKSVRTNKSLS